MVRVLTKAAMNCTWKHQATLDGVIFDVLPMTQTALTVCSLRHRSNSGAKDSKEKAQREGESQRIRIYSACLHGGDSGQRDSTLATELLNSPCCSMDRELLGVAALRRLEKREQLCRHLLK